MPSQPRTEQQLRDFTRVCVRSGLLGHDALHREVAEAVGAGLTEGSQSNETVADAWIEEAREQLRVDQSGGPEANDHERLETAFDELEIADIEVLQGCADETVPAALLRDRAAEGTVPRGVAWFSPADVWRAVDEGLLGISLWHGTAVPAASGEEIVDDVLGILEKHGLEAHFGDGRIDVDAHWYQRIAP